MIRLVVCGDSFMSQDPKFPGEHFSEILNFAYQVTNFARPGVGNVDICFQIKEALELNPDFVLIGYTDSARMEVPIANTTDISDIRLNNFRPGPAQRYISRTIPTLVGEEPDLRNAVELDDLTRRAVKEYYTWIYDHGLKTTTDHWMLGYWRMRLDIAGIRHYTLTKDFCIYRNAREKNSQRVFHTDPETQQEAAASIIQIIESNHANTNTR